MNREWWYLAKAALWSGLRNLGPINEKIVRLHFGIGEEMVSSSELADQLGLDVEEINKRFVESLNTLADELGVNIFEMKSICMFFAVKDNTISVGRGNPYWVSDPNPWQENAIRILEGD